MNKKLILVSFCLSIAFVFFIMLYVYVTNKNAATFYAIAFSEIKKYFGSDINIDQHTIEGKYYRSFGQDGSIIIGINNKPNKVVFTFLKGSDFGENQTVEFTKSANGKWKCDKGTIPIKYRRIGCSRFGS